MIGNWICGLSIPFVPSDASQTLRSLRSGYQETRWRFSSSSANEHEVTERVCVFLYQVFSRAEATRSSHLRKLDKLEQRLDVRENDPAIENKYLKIGNYVQLLASANSQCCY